jgi:hypothetical protein
MFMAIATLHTILPPAAQLAEMLTFAAWLIGIAAALTSGARSR